MPRAEREPILQEPNQSAVESGEEQSPAVDPEAGAGRSRRSRRSNSRRSRRSNGWTRAALAAVPALAMIAGLVYALVPMGGDKKDIKSSSPSPKTANEDTNRQWLGGDEAAIPVLPGGSLNSPPAAAPPSAAAAPAADISSEVPLPADEETATNLFPATSSSERGPRLDPPSEDFEEDLESGKAVPVESEALDLKHIGHGPPFGHPSPTKDYPKHEGFTLWLVEEFDEPLDLDTDPIWTYSDGGLTEGKVRFVKDAIQFRDGKMIIEVSNKGLNQGQSCSHAEVGYVGHKSHTSGEFRTRYNLYRYGRYEVSMKSPSVQPANTRVNGNYISTMFAYRDAKFKHWSEIDIEVTGDGPNAVTANVLKADGTGSWSPGIQDSAHMFPKDFNSRAGFNTYAFEWLPDKITWFLNGKVVRVHRGGRVAIPKLSTKIMMNLWVFNGGGFGGHAVGNNHYPMHNEYDWFRFYKYDGDKSYPCATMDQACLTQDDLYLTSNNPCDGIAQQGTVWGRKPCIAHCTKMQDLRTAAGADPSEIPASSSSMEEPNLVPVEPLLDVKEVTCDTHGCSETYYPDRACQCTSKCSQHNNCCVDYASKCKADTAAAPAVKTVTKGALPYGHPSPNKEYPKHEGFTLWLVEEFDEPLDLDTDPIWTYSDGGLTEGMVRFVKDAIKFEDGKMKIEVSNKGLPQGHSCSHAEVGYVGRKSHTSGEFRSRLNLFRYGRYESSMKAPSVQPGNTHVNGNYISTMFAYRDAKFKHWSEIDVEVTGDGPNAVTANVLKTDHRGTWSPGIQDSAHMFPRGFDSRSKFNTYAFEWLPDKITWFINDKVVRTHHGGRVPVPALSTKIMMNLWVFNGGGFGGHAVGNNRYPMHNEYDWFRFYKWDGDKHYPCEAMDKSCLTEDDMYLTSNNPCDGVPQEGILYGRKPCIAACSKHLDIVDKMYDNATVSVPWAMQDYGEAPATAGSNRRVARRTSRRTSRRNADMPAEDIDVGGVVQPSQNRRVARRTARRTSRRNDMPATAASPFAPSLDPLKPAEDVNETTSVSASKPPVVKDVAGTLPYGHPDTSKEYPTYPGFTLWLVEEFNEPLDLDTDPVWTYSDGGLSEGKVRFVKDAIQFKDGKMMIEVSQKGLPQGQSCSHAEVGYVGHKSHTSGEFRSRLNLFRYGRYEVSMKAPSVQPGNANINGNYISTMFAYRDAKFKHWSEIDVEVTGDRTNAVTANVLKADGTGSWSPGIQDSRHMYPRDFNSRTKFNTYAFEWLPDKITWFVNGEVVRVHKAHGRVPVPSLSTKIMMNLWVFNGGGFGGPQVYNNRYPMHNEYDWFRFYKWDHDTKYPCSAMDKSCLTEDDMYLTSNNPCDGIQQQGKLWGRTPCHASCPKHMDLMAMPASAVAEDAEMEDDDEDATCAVTAGEPNMDPPAADGGLCAAYGCDKGYQKQNSCQCTPECGGFKNCCSDYKTQCESKDAPSPVLQPKYPTGKLPLGHPSKSKSYPQHKGFTLWLVEEFDQPLDLDTDPIWTYSDGGLSEGKVRFVKDAIQFKNGKMMIEVSNKGLPQGDSCSHAEVGYVGHKTHTSGELRTRLNLFRYGRYESSMKAPSVHKGDTHANGNYISTMFAYRDAKFKHWSEIDVEVTGDSFSSVTTNVLKADGISSWNPGIQATQQFFPKGFNSREKFHTYAFEWLPDKVTWFIDGEVKRVHTGGRVPVPSLSTKIMMNLWVFNGGGFGGPQVNNNHYPMHNEYDWFRFYKWDGDTKYPCAAMDKSCLTEDDMYLTGNNPCDGIPQEGTLHGRSACKAKCSK